MKTEPTSVIQIQLVPRRSGGSTVNLPIADERLHALSTFLSALQDGMSESTPDARMNFENSVNQMFKAISRKLEENRKPGELFTIDISSTVDQTSKKLSWTFDFRSDLKKK